MNSFFISALLGAFVTLLSIVMVALLNKGKKGIFFLIFLGFIAVCAASVWLLMFKYYEDMIYCLCGFVAGVPLSAVLIYALIHFFGERISLIFKSKKGKPLKKRKKSTKNL